MKRLETAIYNIGRPALLLGTLLIALCIGSCSGGKDKQENKPVVAVSIPPLATLVDSLAQGRVEVVTVLDEGSDPETFELSMSKRAKLEKADLFISLNVFPFEYQLSSTDPLKSVTINVSNGIEPLFGTHDHAGEEHHEGSHHSQIDPHMWSSAANMAIINDNIALALIDKYPSDSVHYAIRQKETAAQIAALGDSLRARLGGVNPAPFLMWHPSLAYFARDYNLSWGAIQPENKELSAKNLKDKISNAKAQGVSLIFTQKEFDNRQTQTIAEEIGARTVDVNLLSPDWQAELTKVTEEIVRASAPAKK